MNDTERTILEALKELDAAVKSMPTARPKPDLLPIFARLDRLARELPRDTPSDLLHYLHRKSYEKARQFLEARQAESEGRENR